MVWNNPAVGGPSNLYQIRRSLRCNGNAFQSFIRDTGTVGNPLKWTFSTWCRRNIFSTYQYLFGQFGSSASIQHGLRFETDNTLSFLYYNAGFVGVKQSSRLFRDPVSWMHCMCVWDTSNAVASERMRMFVNGERITSFVSSTDPALNLAGTVNNPAMSADKHSICGIYSTSWTNNVYASYDGGMAETYFVDDRALTPLDFGYFAPDTGQWTPRGYAGTYGPNSALLNYKDNTSAAAMGKDYSGRGNDYTPYNVTTLQSQTDSPTPFGTDTYTGGSTSGTFGVWSSLHKNSNIATSDGGRRAYASTVGANHQPIMSTISVPNKLYFEVTVTGGVVGSYVMIGAVIHTGNTEIMPDGNYLGVMPYSFSYGYNPSAGNCWATNWAIAYNITQPMVDGTYGVAIDGMGGKAWIRMPDGSWPNSGNPVLGSNPHFTIAGLASGFYPACSFYNTNTTTIDLNCGQRPYVHPPLVGFNAVSKTGLTTFFKRGDIAFDLRQRAGTGINVPYNVTGTKFQPDFVWTKSRTSTRYNVLANTARGVQRLLASNVTDPEYVDSLYITSFNADGYSCGGDIAYNETGQQFIDWMWKKGAAYGLDIVPFVGNGAVSQTIAHNLGVTPAMMIVRGTGTANWWFYSSQIGGGYYMALNSSAKFEPHVSVWNNTNPTAANFTIGQNDHNQAGIPGVAFLFATKTGFANAGNYYIGTGDTNGSYVKLNFKPRWLMVKGTDQVNDWLVFDGGRGDNYQSANNGNPVRPLLLPNLTSVELSYNFIDFLSDGFKVRDPSFQVNSAGLKYAFLAFAETQSKFATSR